MKLALIVRTLGTHGGTERFVHGLSGWLRDAGHQVEIWCAAVESPVDGVTVNHLPMHARGRAGKLWALHRAAGRVPHGEYDRVLGFVRGGKPGIYRAGGGCHAAFRQRMGRTGVSEWLEERLDRMVVSTAATVVVNSQMAATELQECYGLQPARTRLIYNGVDLHRFQPGSGGGAVGFLGTGFHRKGLHTAIRAVARLPGVTLEVMGRDSRPGHYQRLAAQLGVSDRVHFRGAVQHPETILPQLSALILPTRYDPFANVCLEALACGIPVITSAANGASEILPEPWMVVTDPMDDEAFADRLERALHQRGLSEQCRAAAERLPKDGAYAALNTVIEESQS